MDGGSFLTSSSPLARKNALFNPPPLRGGGQGEGGIKETFELELELVQYHMAQKPMLRGEVGARVRVIRACDQRREGRYGRPDEWVLV